MSQNHPLIKVGCCGFARGMKEYFTRFSLVETQQTFYKMPRPETAVKWRQQAPPNFEFTLKASQLITHPTSSPTYRKAGLKISPGSEGNYGSFKTTPEVHRAWEETEKFARALQARMIVFQCPPSFGENAENVVNLQRFFASIHRDGPVFAWEPRGEWHEATIKDLCSSLDLVHCVDPLVRPPLYGKLQYFRLHGGPGYRHRYSSEELRQVRATATDKETCVLFNNLNVYEDALAFQRSLFTAETQR